VSIRVERGDGLCRVTLARPDKRNALDEATRRGLADLAHELADEPATRVVVLAADGPSFSAGVDLSAPRGGDGSWAARRHASGAWQRTLDAWEAVPQVTVAALQGHCIGDGELSAGMQECVEELLAMPAAPLAMTKAMTRALGQPAMSVAWADADLLHWSRAEPEGQDAAAAYVERRLGKRST
jgi:1,4-dihydroxy-2-naphthoyl-CoA synthase